MVVVLVEQPWWLELVAGQGVFLTVLYRRLPLHIAILLVALVLMALQVQTEITGLLALLATSKS
jgi:hypothetical protein